MRGRQVLLEALGALRGHEEAVEHGWVLLGALRPNHHTVVDSAAKQGLVELADRETRAELSVYEGGPVRWAARLTGHGHDVLAYAEAGPAPGPRPGGLADGERLVELRRSEMDALRLYIHLGSRLHVSPAEGLADKVRTARLLGNRWVLYLNGEQVDSPTPFICVRWQVPPRRPTGSAGSTAWLSPPASSALTAPTEPAPVALFTRTGSGPGER